VTDNTTLYPGTGGDVIRSVDRVVAKTQVVGLDVGGEAGPESLVTRVNRLPVALVPVEGWTETELLYLILIELRVLNQQTFVRNTFDGLPSVDEPNLLRADPEFAPNR
jgi:hypothetical protein